MNKLFLSLCSILMTFHINMYAMEQWPDHCKNLWCPEKDNPISTQELLDNNIFWKNLSETDDQELKNQHLAEALDLSGGDPLYSKRRKVLACALATGANPDIGTSFDSRNVTYNAALKNDYYLAQYALKCGADPNKNFGFMHEPPLFNATTKTMAQLLIDHKADLFAKGNNGNSNVLRNAVIHSYLELIPYYIRLGIDINAQTQNGETPLMASTSYIGNMSTSYKIIKILLAHGANPYIHDEANETFLDKLNRSNRLTPEQVQKIQNIADQYKHLKH